MKARTLLFLAIFSSATISCCGTGSSPKHSGKAGESELLTSSQATVVQTVSGRVAGYMILYPLIVERAGRSRYSALTLP